MKWIKDYSKFKESITYVGLTSINLKESLLKDHNDLLSSVGKKLDLPSTLFLEDGKLDLDELNSESKSGIVFINSLSSLGLKKSSVKNSLDFENFINKPCKFMFLYSSEKDEIENPDYILFQTWNETLKSWDDLELYSVESDINNFLNKLTSRTIQITDGSKNYIYNTSNGNDWTLKDDVLGDDIYKKNLTKEELQKIIDEREILFNVE